MGVKLEKKNNFQVVQGKREILVAPSTQCCKAQQSSVYNNSRAFLTITKKKQKILKEMDPPESLGKYGVLLLA